MQTAQEVVGKQLPASKKCVTNDPEVVALSERRHKLRLQLNCNKSDDRVTLRREINLLKNKIKKRLKAIHNQEAKTLAEEITSTDDSRRMFEAMRQLSNYKTNNNIHVHDDDGNTLGSDVCKANVLGKWFEKQFTSKDDKALATFEGEPCPLNDPISVSEVRRAAQKLKNGRACGPDNIPSELLKYAGDSYFSTYANIINECFETNTVIDELGQGIITPLQKPGKPKGPKENLRPLTLSNGVRKILSLVTLHRIGDKVDQYTGPWQAGYKHGRSCSDLVWCQRMLISVVQNRHFEFHKMGIDMSKAFDTIKRQTILNLLKDAGCNQDEIRLVRLLLSNTKLKVRVNNNLSAEFESVIGAFQGDSLSGNLFTLTLAGALNHLRVILTALLDRPNPPIAENGMPNESEYADDVDFLDEDLPTLQAIFPISEKVLKEWNLNVNNTKTEFVHFHLANKGDLKPDSTPLSGNEEWRASKLLGSLLCSTKDIIHRINLGHVAFNNFKKVWLQRKTISLSRKLQIYEAQVVSVIMYNSSTWAAPKHVIEKVNVCHRRHLRYILNYKYPYIISNKNLYARCQTTPLSERIILSRWRMLGHILRSPENSPASLALSFAVEGSCEYKSRRGRHQTNLFNVIKTDLSDKGVSLLSIDDLYELRQLANDRHKWKMLLI
jgi:hypothetical protein